MSLGSFQPKNLLAQVVDSLGKRIITKHYKEAEKLPIEAELCAEYGVSRPIIREATKVLIAKGLLHSKPRVGTVVRDKRQWNVLDSEVLAWTIEHTPEREFLDNLFQVRMAIEPQASELAATNASAEDIQLISEAYSDMELANTPADLLEPDIRFHQAIMDATHNELMSYIGNTLHSALAVSIRLTSRHPNTHALSLPRHKAVLTAIQNSNPAAAKKATTILLNESRKDFEFLREQKTNKK